MKISKSIRKKNMLILFALLTHLLALQACTSQDHGYKVETLKNGIKVIVGELTWQEWKKAAGWKSYSAENYIPEDDLLGAINTLANSDDVSFLFFGASWCPDSETEMPKVFKLFKRAGVSFEKIKLFGLSLKKDEPAGIARAYNIERVPTLVMLQGGKEIGRIVEFPKKTWEEDLLMM